MCSVFRQLVKRRDKLEVCWEEFLSRWVQETVALTNRGVSHAHYITNLCNII